MGYDGSFKRQKNLSPKIIWGYIKPDGKSGMCKLTEVYFSEVEVSSGKDWFLETDSFILSFND